MLTAGCIKDEAAVPALRGGDRLTLQLPEPQQVAVTRAATAARMPDRQSLCAGLPRRCARSQAGVRSGGGIGERYGTALRRPGLQPAGERQGLRRGELSGVGRNLVAGACGRQCRKRTCVAARLRQSCLRSGRAGLGGAADVRIGRLVGGFEHLLAGAFAGQSFHRDGELRRFCREDRHVYPGGQLRKRRAWRFATIRLPTNTKFPTPPGSAGHGVRPSMPAA